MISSNSNYRKLRKAIINEDVEKIKDIIEKDPHMIIKVDNNNHTLLHVAIMYRKVNAVKILLDKGDNLVYVINSFPILPPLYCAIIGYCKLIRRNKISNSLEKINAHKQIIEALVDKGAELMGLEIALSCKNIWLIKFLIEKGISVEYTGFFPVDINYNTIDIDTCKVLLENKININEPVCGETLVRYAIRSSNLDLLKYLVSKGADIEKRNTYEQDPNIIEAVEKGNLDVVEYLIDNGINIDTLSIYNHKPAIYHAILTGHYNMVDLLLKRGANPFVICEGYTSLISVATQAKRNRLKLINLLLKYGVRFPGDHDYYIQPILLDYSYETYNIIHILLEHGLRITSNTTLVSYVSNYTSLRIFKKLLLHVGDININNPLHFSAMSDKTWHISRFLLEYGADVNVKNRYGSTPLFEAICNCSSKNVKLFLENNADINDIDLDGDATLMKIFNYKCKLQSGLNSSHLRIARIVIPYLKVIGLKDKSVKKVHAYKQNITFFNSIKQLSLISDESDREIDRMKNTILRKNKFGNDITMYDILLEKNMNQLVQIIKNPLIKKRCSELILFKRIVKNNIIYIENRYQKIHSANTAIEFYQYKFEDKWMILPHEIKINILCYLDDKELDYIYESSLENSKNNTIDKKYDVY
ncbi:ankyrin repeat family protein [Flamingopox virus FGPVKD09]|uniref:Ankyrin repeat family protein n=1 Tax=Flamingopox virus FGPVKD09 TaxID=2059380 RepID=A0A2H4X2Q7_9POXV|nr:ankyrin repeat family protein [Flamingopox virus FGPVKD09]AUD40350.1 ankyrin repeat family protein [Flamingopox virus FGPVKD09]